MRHYSSVPLIAFLFFIASPVFADTVTFTKEYTYQASEFDSKHSSRTLALEQVKRLLLEELGTYLVSETEVKDMRLTQDKITTYSAGIVSAEIIDERWDGKSYWLKAKVSADTKEVEKALEKLIQDKSKTHELEDMRNKAEELAKENERLRILLIEESKSKNPDKILGAKNLAAYEETITELNAAEWFRRGYKALITEQWNESLDANTKAIELKPDYVSAYYNRGLAYDGLGNYQAAINDCSKAIELKPNLTVAYLSRGYAYYKLGNYQQAIEDYTKTINLKPDLAQSYTNKGLGYSELHKISQEIKESTKAIELRPIYAQAYYDRGNAYGKLCNYHQAINDYSMSIELTPDDAKAYYNRGVAYYKSGNYQQAIKDFSKAKELKPDYAKAFYYRGVAYVKSGKHPQAIADFTKAIELNPDDATAYYNRGLAYKKSGNYHQAIVDYKIAARLGYKHAQVFLKGQGIQW